MPKQVMATRPRIESLRGSCEPGRVQVRTLHDGTSGTLRHRRVRGTCQELLKDPLIEVVSIATIPHLSLSVDPPDPQV